MIIGTVLVFIYAGLIIPVSYDLHFEVPSRFNTGFINEIHVIKDDRTIIITDPGEVKSLRPFFEGRIIGVGHATSCRRDFSFEVLLVGRFKTYRLIPTLCCGFVKAGLLSFLPEHSYYLKVNTQDFRKHIENSY